MTRAPTQLIDLHVHAKLSKTFEFAPAPFWQSIAQARRVGLDAFALTEHFHTQGFWRMYDELCRLFLYDDGVLHVDDGFRILTGAELSIGEGCDLLAIGSLERLQRFDGALVRPASAGYKPPFDEAVAAARGVGVTLIGAHIFRPGKELARLGSERLRRLDALELNAKDGHMDAAVLAEAGRLGRPVVGGSDAHWWMQVGVNATVLSTTEITQTTVARAIAEGITTTRRLPYATMAVYVSYAYKHAVKAWRPAQRGAPQAV
jgi:predicted metal-dependent phosphoesterase TrpH